MKKKKPWQPSAAERELIRKFERVSSWPDDMREAATEAVSPDVYDDEAPEAFANSEDAHAWLDFDRANPSFYPMFDRFAREAINHGRTRLSAWLIVNRIRWETSIVARKDDGYKISNGLIAFYSRAWSNAHKQHPDFFQQKAMKIEPPNALFMARAAERQRRDTT